MSRIADFVLQVTISGVISLSIMGFVSNLHTTTYDKAASLVMKTNLVTLANTISADFNKIGYHASKPYVTTADSAHFTFKADLNNTGTADTVAYSLVDQSGLSVNREVNGSDPIMMNLNLSALRFSYYDAAGVPTTVAADIKSVKVMVKINDENIKQTTTPMLFWAKMFTINN